MDPKKLSERELEKLTRKLVVVSGLQGHGIWTGRSRSQEQEHLCHKAWDWVMRHGLACCISVRRLKRQVLSERCALTALTATGCLPGTMQAIKEIIGTYEDIPAPDMNTDARVMAW